MMKMTFEIGLVIDTLKANLEEHRQIYAEAVEGYRKEAQRVLNEEVERLKSNPMRPKSVYIRVQAPENHESDYEAVLQMLMQTTDEEVEFTDDQYRCYMLDQWDWQRDFLAANSGYSRIATLKAGK